MHEPQPLAASGTRGDAATHDSGVEYLRRKHRHYLPDAMLPDGRSQAGLSPEPYEADVADRAVPAWSVTPDRVERKPVADLGGQQPR
jgi:hypothetical protein